ncbi:MAG: S41 family peptidase, partial [Bacteroidota bacterium]
LPTGVHLSEASERLLNEEANCLPFTLFYEQGSAIVWTSFDPNSPIKVGDEVVKINGRAIQAIYDGLLGSIPMDGYNQTGKYRLIQYAFPELYRNIIEVASEFEVELANGKVHQLKAVKKEMTFSYRDITNQALSLNIIDNIALIKIPSFANSYLKSHGQKFRKEIKRHLKTIREKDINTLVFDVRGNTGGSDSNPAWLSAFFFEESYGYWDRIEVTPALAADITGFNRIFYGKPNCEGEQCLWSDKGLLSKEFKFTNVQKPAKAPFEGTVYILTDGMCLSSCADFVAIMQANKKALIIGEETGGGYQGNTSGLIPSEPLDCGLMVDVPLLKYYNQVEKGKHIGRGTIPDIEWLPNLDALTDDSDYLDQVIQLIHKDTKRVGSTLTSD